MGGPISKSLIQFSVDGQGCVPSLLFTWGLGLDLIERVPDDLWTEVHDIVQETAIKTIPMEKKQIIREMQIKPTMRDYFTLVKMAIIKKINK